MPCINSVSEQMLMDGPDGLEWRLASDALEDCTERFGHETRTPRAVALARLARGKGGIFPPYQRAFLVPLLLLLFLLLHLLIQHILLEMPALKCALISGFTRSEWS